MKLKNKFKSIKSKIILYISGVILLFSIILCSIFIVFFVKYSNTTAAKDLMHHTISISESISGANSVIDEISPNGSINGNGYKQKKYNANNSSETFRVKGYIRLADKLADADVIIIDKSNGNVITGGEKIYDNYKNMQSEYIELAEKTFLGEEGNSIEKDYMIAYSPVFGKNRDIIGAVILKRPISFLNSNIKNIIILIMVSILIAILLSVMIGILVSGKMINSLANIKDTISKISKGEFGVKVGINRNDEIGELRKSVDHMSQMLENLEEERTKTEQERYKLEKMRDEFISNISHELRTPVTVIRSMIEALSDEVFTDEEEKSEMIEKIKDESIYMQRLVNDTLELSRLQNSEFKIDFEEINILDVVSDAIRTIRQIAKSKDIEVVLKVDNENSAIYVNGDYMRLRQLIIILGDNAIKFSENGEKVEISVEKVDKKIRISVKDYGCGIDGKYKEDIFERFSKSKDESNKVGTGLGLAIAQNIAMRHESLIVVESKVGKGSNFYFDIETTTIER